jgi:hypothetical protein
VNFLHKIATPVRVGLISIGQSSEGRAIIRDGALVVIIGTAARRAVPPYIFHISGISHI